MSRAREEMPAAAIPCLICLRELENPFGSLNQPNRATEFTSPGHYGSEAFDPMDGTALAINICDGCLLLLHGRGTVGIYRDGKFKPWGRSA